MSWCLDEVQAARTKSVLRGLETESAIVPILWAVEISNVLAVSERRKRIDEARITRFLARLSDLPIEVDAGGAEEAFVRLLPLARRHGMSAYDACYLELALRLGIPLATIDGGMAVAAGRAGVALWEQGRP